MDKFWLGLIIGSVSNIFMQPIAKAVYDRWIRKIP